MSNIELQTAKEYAERFQGGNSVSAFRWLATLDALRAELAEVEKYRDEAFAALNDRTRERDEARAIFHAEVDKVCEIAADLCRSRKEIDRLTSDIAKLGAEVKWWREIEQRGLLVQPPVSPSRCFADEERWDRFMAARRAVDASGALERAGGGG